MILKNYLPRITLSLFIKYTFYFFEEESMLWNLNALLTHKPKLLNDYRKNLFLNIDYPCMVLSINNSLSQSFLIESQYICTILQIQKNVVPNLTQAYSFIHKIFREEFFNTKYNLVRNKRKDLLAQKLKIPLL